MFKRKERQIGKRKEGNSIKVKVKNFLPSIFDLAAIKPCIIVILTLSISSMATMRPKKHQKKTLKIKK